MHYDDRLDSLEPMAELLGGSLKKKSMNTIPFNAEMRTLAYVMIHNLYPMMNLTTLSGPRIIFLYDLYTHKEINICGHIYHLLTKSITKRNLRTIMSFLSLIIGLITKTRLKIPSCLTIMPRDYPISANMVTRSKTHITWSRTGISQIPRDNVRKRVETLRKKLIGSPQPWSPLHNHLHELKHRDPIVLIALLQG